MNRKLAVRGGSGDILTATKSRPQDNLYLAVNYDWLKQAKIPADRSRISSFDGIDLNVEKQLMADFAAFAQGDKPLPQIPNFDKAVKLYRLAADFNRRNADGAQPIQADLKLLLGLRDFSDFCLQAADLARAGFALPFSLYVDADMKNTRVNVLHFGGPSTLLPDTTTYQTPAAKKLLDILARQTTKLLTMAGLDQAQAEKITDQALEYDAKIAKVVKSSEEWADYPAMYNPMAIKDFEAKFSGFPMAIFLKETLGQEPDRVINTEPRYLDQVNQLLTKDQFAQIKSWMLLKFINGAASLLSQNFREAAFAYSQALSGQPELSSGIKQAYRIANSTFDEVVGVYYGQSYFGAKAKQDVLAMIKQMLKVYEERLANNDWLSESTKKQAIVKLQSLILKVGYPDKIQKIYDKLTVDDQASLYHNERQASAIEVQDNFAKLTRDVDRTVWLMPGNLVNACYDPQRNDLTFPAAILQAPFYDLKQDRAQNYGGIGTVIAHEISHAFDNNGAKFDERGNMKNWWTDADFAEFKKRTQQEIDLFDGIQYGPVKLNGKQIVSENIADQGGLTAAVEAAKKEGADLRLLFENFARVWATKQMEASIKTQVSVDVHAPGPERANVQVQCQDDFYQVFDVHEGDGMWLAPQERVHIW